MKQSERDKLTGEILDEIVDRFTRYEDFQKCKIFDQANSLAAQWTGTAALRLNKEQIKSKKMALVEFNAKRRACRDLKDEATNAIARIVQDYINSDWASGHSTDNIDGDDAKLARLKQEAVEYLEGLTLKQHNADAWLRAQELANIIFMIFDHNLTTEKKLEAIRTELKNKADDVYKPEAVHQVAEHFLAILDGDF